MAVLLASLVMLAIVNLVGGAVALVLSLARRPPRPAGQP
jgi:hypothetical protein